MAELLETKLLAGLASGPGSPFDSRWVAHMKAKVLSATGGE
jgi:hypothetical protein